MSPKISSAFTAPSSQKSWQKYTSCFLPDVSAVPVSAPRRSSSRTASGPRSAEQLRSIDAAGEVGAHQAVVVVAVVGVEHQEASAGVQLLGNRDGVLGAEEVVRARRHRVVAPGPDHLVEPLRAELDVPVATLVGGVGAHRVGVVRHQPRRRTVAVSTTAATIATNTPNDLPLVQRLDRVVGDEQPGCAEADDDAHVEHAERGDGERGR